MVTFCFSPSPDVVNLVFGLGADAPVMTLVSATGNFQARPRKIRLEHVRTSVDYTDRLKTRRMNLYRISY
jgi:hypothetical protein